ncbi:MAG: DUF4132 domain-containing protein [Ruminococcus sp.]|nr:DUF4132 domain-containing protein [Ruminococcus sp.]
MLYANSSTDCPELTAALAEFDIGEKNLDIFVRFMGHSGKMDLSLLEGAEKLNLRVAFEWKYLDKIEKALNRELLKPGQEELLYRYIVFIYAIGGAMCWRLLYLTGSRSSKKDTYLYRALVEAYGDKGKDICYMIRATYASIQTYYNREFEKAEAADCIAAAELADDSLRARCLLVMFALDQLERGDKLVGKALRLADKAGDYVDHTGLEQKEVEYYFTLLLECGYFDKKYITRLKDRMKRLGGVYFNATVPMACGLKIDEKRIYEVIENDPELVTPDYILCIRGNPLHKQKLAKEYTDVYIEAIRACKDLIHAAELEAAIIESGASYDPKQTDIKGRARARVSDALASCYAKRDIIIEYLCGERALADTMAAIADGKLAPYRVRTVANELNYYTAFGCDEFIARAVTAAMLTDTGYGKGYRVCEYTGFDIDREEGIRPAFEMLRQGGADLTQTIEAIALCIDDMYSSKEKCTLAAVDTLEEHKQELKTVDVKKLGATARVIFAKALGRHPNEFKTELLALCDDGSKAVKAEIIDILSGQKGWAEDIKALLREKKAAKRELALDIISKQGSEGYAEALKAAFDTEKSDKLRLKIGAMIGAAVTVPERAAPSLDKQLEKLVKASGGTKYSFLFERPFKPVHKKNGGEASEDTLRALVMCYSSFTSAQRSRLADDLAAELDEKDLEEFSAEVFGRWYDGGAQAKQKFLLYFCACHGGIPMVRTYMSYIKSWAESMRGAIAAEAVKAMALGGSSEALMNIENMSRKFKNKQVRAAAGESLANAAEALGITTEELADRIVPDLGFDKNLCRVFDYGTRQFRVYITPSLELEIFSGDKRIKALPKPGASDDAEKAAAAANAFKEMKKLLKATVTAQRQRLEYVLMCDRRWTADKWNALFVGNAVMHCFAIGLIWGVYENGGLKETFRYMDDGSFTTASGDEYTLPEGAQIGLVHPIELTKEQIDEWVQQLEDFEIAQPFEQLKRPVYLPTADEKNANKITRFKDVSLNSLTLVNKMTKLNWYKGYAEDAGYFYYFYRDDFNSRNKNPDGTLSAEGYGVLLTFSGASVVVYDFEGEETEIENLIFYKAGEQPSYFNKEEKGFLKIADVSPRYFSEIVMQLSRVLLPKTEEQ